jgi:hypothetical protein
MCLDVFHIRWNFNFHVNNEAFVFLGILNLRDFVWEVLLWHAGRMRFITSQIEKHSCAPNCFDRGSSLTLLSAESFRALRGLSPVEQDIIFTKPFAASKIDTAPLMQTHY